MINIHDYTSKKIAIHCKTEEEAKAFVKECYNKGIKWSSGGTNSDATYFYMAKEYTCYEITDNKLYCSPLDFYKILDYKIIPYSDLFKTLPRICYLLGSENNPIEIGEEFKYNNDFFVIDTLGFILLREVVGNLVYDHSESDYVTSYMIADMLNHPEKIIRKPRCQWTKEHIEKLRAIKVLFPKTPNMIVKYDESYRDFVVLFTVKSIPMKICDYEIFKDFPKDTQINIDQAIAEYEREHKED